MMLENALRRREFIRIGATGVTLPLLSGFATPPVDQLGAARQQVRQFIRDGVPSVSIAVIHHGRPIWVEAQGWADRERRIPARTTTPYAIASASKPFTGMAVAQLIAAGHMALDEPIAKYLGGLHIGSLDHIPVTVRQALHHRSGIPRHWQNFFAGQGEPRPFNDVARDHAFSTSAHTTRYLYSNMNYGLLAAAVESVVGRPFHNHLREAVMRPLALETTQPLETHFYDWRAAVPYEADGKGIPPYRVDEVGARDLIMSAFDLARFGQAHLDGRLGHVGDLMLQERAPLGGSGVGKASYGLGWIVEEESPAALFSYGHTGEGPGAASSLTIVPEADLVVATITNQQGPAAYMLNEMIVDAISPQFAARREAHPFKESAADASALNVLAGFWKGELHTSLGLYPVSVTLQPNAGSQIQVGGQTAKLTHLNVRDGVLSGRAAINVPAEDAKQWPHQARMSLEPSGENLDGTLAAYANRGTLSHDQFWLSYRLRLQKA